MRKKILCICNHGNNRSPGLAASFKDLDVNCMGTSEEYLKGYVGYETIALGAHHVLSDTLKYFIDWAEVVIDMSDEPNRKQTILELAKEKYFDAYPIIGYDSYGNMNSPKLREKCKIIVEKFK